MKNLLNDFTNDINSFPKSIQVYLNDANLTDDEKIAIIAEDIIDLGKYYLRSI